MHSFDEHEVREVPGFLHNFQLSLTKMAPEYLKKASKPPTSTSDEDTVKVVRDLLFRCEKDREEAVKALNKQFDGYIGDVVVSKEQIEKAATLVSSEKKLDIKMAMERVRKFAEAQRASIEGFEMEVSPGTFCGQRIISIDVAGCYVPGGRYSHIASAIMSITTAKVAGVRKIVAATAPHSSEGCPCLPEMLYTMNLCGADEILIAGGVQGIASLCFGLFTGLPAKILVGPGNRFVAEAKRCLYGRVGIDMFAGPTEIGIIADNGADPMIVAEDLTSQAEHGPDSPCWLITTDRKLGAAVLERMDSHIQSLPEPARTAAEAAWRDHGEVVLCASDEEACSVSDSYAPEHLELQTGKNEWYTEKLLNYGSLFIGEESTVTYGDKISGTNHILPTKGAGHYTGGLSVHKFLKVVTTQRMTREATREIGPAAARISRMEGMEGHARAADVRVRKYFPNEDFELGSIQ